MAEVYQSPGIGYTEQERTIRSSTVLDPVVAIVGGAIKGPTEITRLGNRRQLRNKYGASVANDNGVFGADYILDGDCLVLYRRVVGSAASKGAAGTASDRFVFRSRWMDSSLNGYKIDVKFSEDKKTVDYKVTSLAGAVIENYVGLSNEVGSKRFLPTFLDSINSDIEAVLNDVTETGVPAVAGKRTYTIATNFATGDVVTFGGEQLTAGTDFEVGLDSSVSAINLASALGAAVTDYTFTAKSGVITAVEKVAGSGKTPGTMTVGQDDTGVITAGEATTSTAATPAIAYTDESATLAGVNDGIESLTAADYIAAAEDFANPETVDFSMIIVPGVSDISVQEAYQALVARRGNAEYLPDVPFGLSPVEAKAFFDANPDRTTPKLDNMFVSAFAPWWKVIDPSSHQARWAPPSVVVARVTVDSDTRSGGCWFAAAGFAKVGSDIPGRGSVPNAVEGEYQLTQDQRDSWQEENGVLNPIIVRRGRGTVVFGNRTCKRTEAYSDPSVFCDRNIRRMCNYIRRMLIDLSLGFVFDPNDSQTWKDWKATIRPFLRQIRDGRGISDFRVIMDETTVTDEDIRNRQAPGVVMIRPIRSIEWIPITFIATENGLLFNDEEEEE